MTAYRLFGAETSPYSLKVRSFLRYKGVDFEWIGRSKATDEELQRSILVAQQMFISDVINNQEWLDRIG